MLESLTALLFQCRKVFSKQFNLFDQLSLGPTVSLLSRVEGDPGDEGERGERVPGISGRGEEGLPPTQRQALNALVFFYDQALKEPLDLIADFAPARKPKRLPMVLGRKEMGRLLEALSEPYSLMAGLLYGAGFRLIECIRHRVQGIDFGQNQIVIRDGKGNKDRGTILPDRYRPALRETPGESQDHP